jgi:hypothetical protein
MAALNVPVNRDYRTIDELTFLVKSIRDTLGAQETNWVEWKGPLDVSGTAGKFLLAKGILAFANRSPLVARRACAGVAYMIAGVEPGTVHGVAAIDHADLEKGVKRFVDGPRWKPDYIEIEPGKTVLVITVEAPNWGDRIHTLQRTFEKYELGMIFHREGAKSQQARPRDIAMLEDRRLRGVLDPDVDLVITMEDAEPLARMGAGGDHVDDWLQRRKASLDQRVPKPRIKPPPTQTTTAGLLGIWQTPQFQLPELSGLLDPYTNEAHAEFTLVEDHLKTCRRRLVGNARAEVCRSEKNKLRFHVENSTEDPTSSVVVTARFSCPDLEVFSGVPPADPLPSPPTWPHPVRLASNYPNLVPARMPALAAAGPTVRRRGDTFEIDFVIGDLRPRQRKRTGAVTVIPGLDAPDKFEIKLTGHAMNRRGRTTERVTVRISDHGWPLDALVEDPECD